MLRWYNIEPARCNVVPTGQQELTSYHAWTMYVVAVIAAMPIRDLQVRDRAKGGSRLEFVHRCDDA